MDEKRILGLDIGHKRTGIAISDESQRISFPLGIIETEDRQVWIGQISQRVEESQIGKIVVGLPLNQHGEEGEDARKIREFIALLRAKLIVPVVEWDERFTTVQAERVLLSVDISRKKRKRVVDQTAASILLQSYLDSLHFQKSGPCEEY